MKYERPHWDIYFMTICESVALRGTCDRGRTGCVVVKDNHILCTGYVGAPAGLPSCDDVGHEYHKVIHGDGSITEHCIRTAHAEQNAIVQAAKVGVSLLGSTMYMKMAPCYSCAKMIANVGAVKVVAAKDYQASQRTKDIFKDANIELIILDSEITKY
jgi:dCMP deaminase